MRRAGAALGLTLLLTGCVAVPETPGAAMPERVLTTPSAGAPAVLVVASVAGLPAALPASMPTLGELARSGVVAERVDVVTPESPYPVHATYLSGRRPRDHGILGDRLIGEKGVRRARPWHASHTQVPALWDGLDGPVLALDWPSTQGAPVAAVLPDVQPTRRDETWLSVIADSTTPWLLALAKAAPPTVARSGPERDRFLVGAACTALTSAERPRLVLLRLRGAERGVLEQGPQAAEAAFAEVDRALATLLGCLDAGPGLSDAAVVVAGDRALRPVHTAVRPNRTLAHAGLQDDDGWQAVARSNGGSAFVYARDSEAAVAARRALAAEAEGTGAFRVVSAEEMIAAAADPEAWFGLEAEPGFAFLDGRRGPFLAPSPMRASGGYLTAGRRSPAFVAWGRGIRSGLVVPSLHQLDVAPTLAQLLDAQLPEAEGRSLIGLLRVPGAVAAPPPEDELEATSGW